MFDEYWYTDMNINKHYIGKITFLYYIQNNDWLSMCAKKVAFVARRKIFYICKSNFMEQLTSHTYLFLPLKIKICLHTIYRMRKVCRRIINHSNNMQDKSDWHDPIYQIQIYKQNIIGPSSNTVHSFITHEQSTNREM